MAKVVNTRNLSGISRRLQEGEERQEVGCCIADDLHDSCGWNIVTPAGLQLEESAREKMARGTHGGELISKRRHLMYDSI
jgi:hypothetical protein